MRRIRGGIVGGIFIKEDYYFNRRERGVEAGRHALVLTLIKLCFSFARGWGDGRVPSALAHVGVSMFFVLF